MTKHIARQVAPEYQESLWRYDIDGRYCILGNRNYVEHTTDTYDYLVGNVETWIDDWLDMHDPEATWIEPMSDGEFLRFEEIEKSSNEPWTKDEIKQWGRIFNGAARRYIRPEIICQMLSLLDGGKWEQATLSGYSQGEWVECLYDTETYTDDDIKLLEIAYFNTGTEWVIDDDCGVYCYEAGDENIRKELAEYVGCSPEEIEMHVFDGYEMVPKYRIMEVV